MKRLPMCVLFLAGMVQADGFAYRFEQTCRDCWPGWEVVDDPASGRQISVADGRGQIIVEGINQYHGRNTQHLLWKGSAGSSSASMTFAFEGTAGKPGWFYKLSDGTGGVQCAGIPEVAADEGTCITWYDTGQTWLEACAGLPHAFGIDVDDYPHRTPAKLMLSFFLAQVIDGERHVLGIKTLPAVRMGQRLELRGWVQNVRASGTLNYGNQTFSILDRPLAQPQDKNGGLGLEAIVAPASACVTPLRAFGYYGVSL